jgi:ADP-heptose:LPS heptosyltransferase
VNEFSFPALGVLNRFMMGDAVLVEPIARELAINEQAYVVSNYPELYKAHPTVRGVRNFDELPDNVRIIDLSESIKSIEGKGEDRHVIENKYLNMCKEAGFQRALNAPRLYLTPSEWTLVQELRKFFPDKPNIGVAIASAHVAKNWLYIIKGIKALQRKGYNVFIFSDKLNKATDWMLPRGIYHIIGRSLREMMQYVAMMDAMMGPDTGPMHVAGALKVPLAVICYSIFAHLYEMYDNVAIMESDNFTLQSGIKGVSVRKMLSSIDGLLEAERKAPVVDIRELESMKPKSHASIRINGIGDIGLSLPAWATIRSQNGNESHSYTYITNHAGAALLKCTDLFDEVIEVDYKHGPAGFPLPPPGIDYDRFDTVANLINVVDFLPQSTTVPRTELFARAIGLDKVDYSAPGWKLTIPESWKLDAWGILQDFGVTLDDRILVLQADTKGRARMWPKERQVEFCGLAIKRGWKVVLVSDIKKTRYPKAVINLTGQLSVEEYYAMIDISTIGVSPDSALMHVAGMTDNNAIALFGPIAPELRIAHYDTVYPIIGKDKYCMKGGKVVHCNDWQNKSCSHFTRFAKCMWNIKAKEVFDKVEEVSRMGREAGAVEEL